MMVVTLVVDSRESLIMTQLTLKKIDFNTLQLPVGDFLLKTDETVLYIIERKSHSDFCSSVLSGRFREQRERLKQFKIDNPDCTLIVLLEGLRVEELPPSCLGTLENLVLYHKVAILPTASTAMTAETLGHMITKLTKLLPHNGTSVSTVGVSRGVKLQENTFLHQLALVQGVSLKVAGEITKTYKNCRELVEALVDKGEGLLETVPNGKRKLGKVVSKRIYTIFMGE